MKYDFMCILSSDELKASNYIRPSFSIPCDSDFSVSIFPYNDSHSLRFHISSYSNNIDLHLYADHLLMFDQHILFDLVSEQFNKLSDVLKDVVL